MLEKIKLISLGGVPMLLNYIGLNTDMVAMLLFLIILDICTGFFKAFTLRTIESKKGEIGISKKMLMLLVLIAVAVLGKMAYLNGIFIKSEGALSVFLDYVVLAFAFLEFFSTIQNIYVGLSKKEVKELDAFFIIIETIYNISTKAIFTIRAYAKKVAENFINNKLK